MNFLKKDYKASLTNYTLALKSNPNCPAYVRLGIGLCAIQLGDFQLARISLERVLVLDRTNVEALVALAILHLSKKSNMRDSIHTCVAYLEKAYRIDPANPLVLSMLADHLYTTYRLKSVMKSDTRTARFYQGDHQAVLDMAVRSSELTSSSHLKSRNDYFIARSYHILDDFSQASSS